MLIISGTYRYLFWGEVTSYPLDNLKMGVNSNRDEKKISLREMSQRSRITPLPVYKMYLLK